MLLKFSILGLFVKSLSMQSLFLVIMGFYLYWWRDLFFLFLPMFAISCISFIKKFTKGLNNINRGGVKI